MPSLSIDVNEAQQQFVRKTNNGNQKLTRAMDTSSCLLDPTSSSAKTNKQTCTSLRETDNNKRQTKTSLDVWVYQRRESETEIFNIDTF